MCTQPNGGSGAAPLRPTSQLYPSFDEAPPLQQPAQQNEFHERPLSNNTQSRRSTDPPPSTDELCEQCMQAYRAVYDVFAHFHTDANPNEVDVSAPPHGSWYTCPGHLLMALGGTQLLLGTRPRMTSGLLVLLGGTMCRYERHSGRAIPEKTGWLLALLTGVSAAVENVSNSFMLCGIGAYVVYRARKQREREREINVRASTTYAPSAPAPPEYYHGR
eukprot:comp12667_c0_seq1/m.7749 comp12667_c0_seq1/g.7749  ORF comp12667_c0_seq1/g.7749 comp12667_c0_seq1/m.7749 type:complete len:218 (-) comp12667_c0_seq1:220-873(-)